jgi:mRNA-degrading endonuclease YafQ of YafQ-DinJ toxin-antitoxin module
MESKKIWRKTSRIERILTDLEKEWKYSKEQFSADVNDFLNNENDKRYGKHGIVIKWGKVWSIILWYDLRTLYFLVEEHKWIIEYVFFDIGNHDDVYSKKARKWFRII